MTPRYCLLLLLVVPIFAAADAGSQSSSDRQAVVTYNAGPCTAPGVPAGCRAPELPVWYGLVRPVYVVTENHYTGEGFGIDTPKYGDLIAIQIFDTHTRAPDQPPVHNVGERIALFVGGEGKGDISIRKVLPFQCDSFAALVSMDPSVRLAKDAMALATNSEKVRTHANKQRRPDAVEINYAKNLAMNEFRKHGVSQELATQIKVDRLVVTRIDYTKSEFLIGSLFLEARDAVHQVFLIGRLYASGATAELARYHKTTDLEDGTDSEDVRLVDQLDFDGDGTDEVVVEIWGYESEEFGIYRRLNGAWNEVYVGGQGGC
jgi:hypothetical protein